MVGFDIAVASVLDAILVVIVATFQRMDLKAYVAVGVVELPEMEFGTCIVAVGAVELPEMDFDT